MYCYTDLNVFQEMPERVDLMQLLLDAEISDDEDEVFTDKLNTPKHRLTQEVRQYNCNVSIYKNNSVHLRVCVCICVSE